MKKQFLLAILFMSFLTFSCKKETAIVPESKAINNTDETSVPAFNEANSEKVAWEDFPAELKNATPIPAQVEKKEGSLAETSYSYYQYSVGPWGGGGGGAFSIAPPAGSRIYAIAIRAGGLVDRFTVWYVNANGTIFVGGDPGGNGGTYFVQFFSADEYIWSVGGRSGAYLDRLTIATNRKTFSYGGSGGSPFSTSVPAGYQVLGFFGRSGGYVDRIGFYVYTR